MAIIRKQYKGFKIRIKRTESGFFEYKVKDTPIKDIAPSANDAHGFAMDDIENYLGSK